jgi:hypothetical protein
MCRVMRHETQEKSGAGEGIRTLDNQHGKLRAQSISADVAPSYDDGSGGVSLSVSSAVQNDADLRRVVTAWPTLPESVRAGIVAMVDTLCDRR